MTPYSVFLIIHNLLIENLILHNELPGRFYVSYLLGDEMNHPTLHSFKSNVIQYSPFKRSLSY